MNLFEKIRIIDNKIKKNKAQYNLVRQTTMISVLSLINVDKYEFLTGTEILPAKPFRKSCCNQKS